MPVLGMEMRACAGDVGNQPLAVGDRHHPIVRALPDMDLAGDRPEVEAPWDRERQVVV